MKVGIIGGRGWIGRALSQALIGRQVVSPQDLVLSGTGRDGRDIPAGARYTCDNAELVAASEVVVLSVRPEQFRALRLDASHALVISVMAGVPIASIEAQTRARRIVRAMPNAGASLGLSFTPMVATAALSGEDHCRACKVLESIGRVADAAQESELDYFAGLTGSGPAFLALLADAMISAAVERGIREPLAREGVLALVEGAARLLCEGAETPAEVVRQFVDYRGTTAAALNTMRVEGFASAVRAGLQAAERRAATLG